MCVIFESVLMLLTENYQNWSMLVETTACQIWRVFLRHNVVVRFVIFFCKFLCSV